MGRLGVDTGVVDDAGGTQVEHGGPPDFIGRGSAYRNRFLSCWGASRLETHVAGILGLLFFVVFLLWFIMSAPIGTRTVRRTVRTSADPTRVWNALYPFGTDYDWDQGVTQVIETGPESGREVTTYLGRDGLPVEKDFVVSDLEPGERFTMRYTNDTALAQSFWDHYVMTVRLEETPDGSTHAEITETDRYHGAAFLLFRFFALRRSAGKLKRWAETGVYKPGGLFERPATQFAMAGVSALILWPLFGLDLKGAVLATTLTIVVGMHEIGHMVAFKMMGHKTARVIFLPLLGGIAIGGRPYDRHFEVGFAALMGAGFSAFPVAALTWLAFTLHMRPIATGALAVLLMIMSLFNLGNLMPVWKFDGGQVLRQIFRTTWGMAGAAFATLMIMAAAGVAAGLPLGVLVICGAVIAMLSVMTSRSGVAPKTALTPMTEKERIALGMAFIAVLAVHAIALSWSIRRLFYS
ncbi:site-2 protease family protein [Oricola sp.]|uniref:site-2 protease family protein n=1 Tax=Oricola sp. TaxID=1979950 RepID=UPI0025D6E5D9|nr:site-2 protease family protein [Oricola sp.]MCI5073757.1 site-2 protease family protein [Oricola sp.]